MQNSQLQYFILNLSHLLREHKYITFWRPECKGYAFPLSWSGRYSHEEVMSNLGYFNSGCNVAVPCSVVEPLAVSPAPGDIDNNAGPVVLNNAKNWKILLAQVIAKPTYEVVPVYKGSRRAMSYQKQR